MAKKVIFLSLLLLFVLALFNWSRITQYFRPDTRTINEHQVTLLFREDPGEDFLLEQLIQNGILRNKEDFKGYVAKNNIHDSDFAAGKYVILSGTQLSSLIEGFTKDEHGNGKAEIKVNVDFNRCRFVEDIGANISRCILADSASIVGCIKDNRIQKKYGFTEEGMLAMFLPKRYKMYFDTDAEEFVAIMAQEFKYFWNKERMEKINSIGLNSPSEVTTLASIVYSEQSKLKEEWPIIAKLYINRINKGMRLQSDPTFKFCWGYELDGVERLLNKHKNIDCSYNTYKIDGLPPGPICLVPGEVIDAVLNPANVAFLFMCGKPGGKGHNFAVSNREHEKNATEYRIWLKNYLKEKK